MLKLLRMIRSIRWKNSFFVLFSSLSATRERVHRVVTFVYIPHVSIIVLYYGQFHGFSILITENTLQWWRMHVRNMQTFCLTFHTMAVKSPFTLVFRSPLFIFILCPEFFCTPFLKQSHSSLLS
jgi:hypothetical protein